jgi:Secretion system C-terminal sorting domain
MGHHWSMDAPNQDKAVQLINKDCNMFYLQDYVSTSVYPPLDENYFDKRANYFKAAKAYRPDMKVSMTTNRFPIALTQELNLGGKIQPVLRTDDPDIYAKVAKFYFDLFQGFKNRGVEIDILNVVNEPDWDKQYYYGQNGDTKKAVALLFADAVPKFKALLRDTNLNKSKIKIPQIMGPSTIGPQGCLDYMRYFKQNYPTAWTEIDIVATHQYTNGVNEPNLTSIKTEAAGKPFFQSEMHTNRGDNLGAMPIDSAHRGVLSLASLISSALRNGVNAWFYFQTNYPHAYTPAGLIQVDWQSNNPTPYQHYYALKQMTATQPAFSHLVGRSFFNFGASEIFIFRKKNKDTVYLNVANFLNQTRTVTIDIKGENNAYRIKNFSQNVTDGVLKNERIADITLTEPAPTISPSIRPYSINTFKIVLKKEPITAIKDDFIEKSVHISQIGDNVQIDSKDNLPFQSITVYNISGQIMANYQDMKDTQMLLNVTNWTTGLYFFSIKKEGKNREILRGVIYEQN